ncbi:hypothetical protein K488DRAFT_77564 [Vararia minispora EC-137]|uniref:Uncharacterized protein n=1 Tax=Vararia minispora EC-137 TaxID=1314806 RepID=A0ACB8QQ82_9AGAM|nr:hypothetical protein K488DRAFT_77564 [Vararia minispora EC-137]
MSLRRRIGVSTATSESARRQLMQPVQCWEKVWTTAPSTNIKIYKWVKTDRTQQFGEDEGGVDEPLAPLPDEPEIVEGDDDDQEEAGTPSNAPEGISRAASESQLKTEPPSKLPSPKPHPLSISFQPSDATDGVELDDSLKVLDGSMEAQVDVPGDLNSDTLPDLDMSTLGPDGTSFEAAGDLTQLQSEDALLGGEMMDTSMADDPFAIPPE